MSKHTSGPWHYEDERYATKCVIGVENDDRWVAHCQPEFNGEANGRLIAAAPDLLFALEEAMWIVIHRGLMGEHRTAATLELMRQAITKAKGEV